MNYTLPYMYVSNHALDCSTMLEKPNSMYFTYLLSQPCCLLCCQQVSASKNCTVVFLPCSRQQWSASSCSQSCSPWDLLRATTAQRRESTLMMTPSTATWLWSRGRIVVCVVIIEVTMAGSIGLVTVSSQFQKSMQHLSDQVQWEMEALNSPNLCQQQQLWWC